MSSEMKNESMMIPEGGRNKITYLAEEGCIHIEWTEIIGYSNMITNLQLATEMIKKYRTNKCLYDLTETMIYGPGVQQYMTNQWLPGLSSMGIKYAALLDPNHALNLTRNQWPYEEARYMHQVLIRNFNQSTGARNWLRNFE